MLMRTCVLALVRVWGMLVRVWSVRGVHWAYLLKR